MYANIIIWPLFSLHRIEGLFSFSAFHRFNKKIRLKTRIGNVWKNSESDTNRWFVWSITHFDGWVECQEFSTLAHSSQTDLHPHYTDNPTSLPKLQTIIGIFAQIYIWIKRFRVQKCIGAHIFLFSFKLLSCFESGKVMRWFQHNWISTKF